LISDKGTDVVLTTGIGEDSMKMTIHLFSIAIRKYLSWQMDALKKWIATFLLGAPTLT
jgi:hypothetical protein